MLCTIPSWLAAAVTDLPPLAPRSAEARRARGRHLARLASLLWRLAIRLCFWLKLDVKGMAPMMQRAGLGSRRVFLCVNHVSYLDTPLVCVLVPWRIIGDIKTLMAKRMLSLPMLGRLAHAIGHLPIPYTTQTHGNFAMDREELARIQLRIDEHIIAGGHLIVFPEGELNAEWEKLRQFRAGGFEICIRQDMELWGLLVAGTADTWPSQAILGGGPGLLTCRAVLIEESGREAAVRLGGPEASLQQQGRALAAHAQAAMQRTLDEMVAARAATAGWRRGSQAPAPAAAAAGPERPADEGLRPRACL